jgi:hypothetical protein
MKIRSTILQFLNADRQAKRHDEINRRIFTDFPLPARKKTLSWRDTGFYQDPPPQYKSVACTLSSGFMPLRPVIENLVVIK